MPDAASPEIRDVELVATLRYDRSELAFRTLYRRHTPALLRTAWRLLGQAQDDAEDAVQESWMRALASLDQWRGEGSFVSWLKGIVVRVSLDILRRQRRVISFSDDVEAPSRDVTHCLDLEAAIATLAPGYRAVLVLHDVEGFTHEEIGAQLGISAGTSKGQLFKARRAIRKYLKPTYSKSREP